MVVAAGSVLTEDPTPTTTTTPEDLSAAVAAAERAYTAPSTSGSSNSSSTLPKTGSSKWVIDPTENLKSTLEHRLWTYGCMGLLSASLAGAAADVHSVGDAGSVLGAMFAAYALSDLGTAVYHWVSCAMAEVWVLWQSPACGMFRYQGISLMAMLSLTTLVDALVCPNLSANSLCVLQLKSYPTALPVCDTLQGVDNYGDGNTPVFGRQIAAFQGHHQRPWTITQREFCNNVHQVSTAAAHTH